MSIVWKQPHWYHTLTYKGDHIQFVQSFKYIGIDVPSTKKWSVCLESRLQVGTIIIYWRNNVTKMILMDGKWNKCNLMPCLLKYSLIEWKCGATISFLMQRMTLGRFKRGFLRRQMSVKSTTSCYIMFLEALQRVYIYITKLKNMRGPHCAWNVGCKL